MLTRLKNDLAGLDLARPDEARAALQAKYPLSGDYLLEVRRLCERGVEEGWLCSTERGGVRFSRLTPPDKYFPYSVDAVLLRGPAAEHRHPKGEINIGWPVEGEPRFCGLEPGWSVFAPGSRHVPEVTGGGMLLLYFLPDGAIEWSAAGGARKSRNPRSAAEKAARATDPRNAAGRKPAARKAVARKAGARASRSEEVAALGSPGKPGGPVGPVDEKARPRAAKDARATTASRRSASP
jgi:hypothetical protein